MYMAAHRAEKKVNFQRPGAGKLTSPVNHSINFFKSEFYGHLCVDPCLCLKSAVTVFRYLRMKHLLCA